MAGLLYFRPGSIVRPTAQEIVSLGLTFDHEPCFRECTGRGPSGAQGVTIADPVRMGEYAVGYYPDQQQWEPVPFDSDAPGYYVGWYREARPGPADLARDKQIMGRRVTLADGQEWLVPLVQEWLAEDEAVSVALPRSIKRSSTSNWVYGDVEPLYQSLWNAAREFWRALLSAAENTPAGSPLRIEYPPLIDFACQLLAINYQLSPDDISALELFNSEATAARVATTAVDWPTFLAWIEKKSAADPASESSSPGPAASIDDTDPPSPTTRPSLVDST